MDLGATFWAGSLLVALAAAGCVYEIVAIAMLRRFFAQMSARGSDDAVTLLKPLHGAEPRRASWRRTTAGRCRWSAG